MARPLAVLIGGMGAGKTTVGRLLAERLGVPLRDTDADIINLTGLAVADVFAAYGESGFRDIERHAVAKALAEHPGVLSLGGGAVLAAETQALLAGQTVVYLRVSPVEALARVGDADSRPLLAGDPEDRVAAILAERVPVYERLAVVTIDTDGKDPGSIAREIETAIEAGTEALR